MVSHIFSEKDKPEIVYPCLWQYKVIGRDHDEIVTAIRQVCEPIPVEITYSHSSSGNKYHSYSVEIEVQDDEARVSLFTSLHNHPAIKFVI